MYDLEVVIMFTEKLALVIQASTQGAVQPIRQLQAEADKTGKSFQQMNGVIGVSMAALRQGLVAGASALAGVGIVSGVNRMVDAFVKSQAAAGQFARAMNSTVEEAGKLSTVMRALGVETNDLIEINAEFSQNLKTQSGLMAELGVQMERNADGSTNMARTLVATLDALSEMDDGLRAAQIAAKLFGEEGSKQLFAFYSAGIKVSDLMKRIDFTDASSSALKYRAATLELNLALQQLMVTAGAKLVPVLTELVDLSTTVVNVFEAIPLSSVAVVAGWGLLAAKGKQLGASLVATAATVNAVRRSFTDLRDLERTTGDFDRLIPALRRMGSVGQEAVTAITEMRDAWDESDRASTKGAQQLEKLNALTASGTTSGAKYEAQVRRVTAAQLAQVRAAEKAEVAMNRAVDATIVAENRFNRAGRFQGMATAFLAANSYMIALTAVAAELLVVTTALQAEDKAVKDNIANWIKLEGILGDNELALMATADQMARNESIMARFGAALKSWTHGEVALAVTTAGLSIPFTNLMQAISGGSDVQETFRRDLERTRKEMGEFAAQGLRADQAVRTLNDAIAALESGTDNTAGNLANIAEGAQAANDQLLRQARITDMTATAMGKYAQSVQQATKYQGDLVSRKGGVQSALEDLTNSVKGLFTAPGVKVKDLPSTFQDEWEQAAIGVEDSVWKVIQSMAEVGLSGDQIRQKFQDMGVLENLPKDVRTKVQAALDEIKGLPTERVMDFTIKPKIDWGGKDFADFLKQQGTRAADPTQFKKLMDEFRAQASALKIPVTQDVKVKVDQDSLTAAQTTVTEAFTAAPIVPTVNTGPAAKQLAGLADTKITIVPEADRDAATTERGWLETTLGPTISPPVVPVVHDAKAAAALNKLTGDRTMLVHIKYVDANGNPISAPGTAGTVAPQAAAVSYGPSMSIGTMTVQANDPGKLYAGLDRIARRQRLVGMPA